MRTIEDVSTLLSSLGKVDQLCIALLLLEDGDQSLAQLVQITEHPEKEVTDDLKQLELAGVVQNYIFTTKTEVQSRYQITRLGKCLLDAIIAAYNSYYSSLQEPFKVMRESTRKK